MIWLLARPMPLSIRFFSRCMHRRHSASMLGIHTRGIFSTRGSSSDRCWESSPSVLAFFQVLIISSLLTGRMLTFTPYITSRTRAGANPFRPAS